MFFLIFFFLLFFFIFLNIKTTVWSYVRICLDYMKDKFLLHFVILLLLYDLIWINCIWFYKILQNFMTYAANWRICLLRVSLISVCKLSMFHILDFLFYITTIITLLISLISSIIYVGLIIFWFPLEFVGLIVVGFPLEFVNF